MESVSEQAGRHSCHGTNSLGTADAAESCRVAREVTGRDWGNAESAVGVPVPDPDSQTAIRDTQMVGS